MHEAFNHLFNIVFIINIMLFSGVSHPMALVPLTEENEDAMENKKFQRLLRKVGIRAPADEQVKQDFNQDLTVDSRCKTLKRKIVVY